MKRRSTWLGVAMVAAAMIWSAPTRAEAAGAGAGAKAAQAQAPQDKDQTLHAMRDEMARSKTRLELNIPGTNEPVKPYYIEYRLLDLVMSAAPGPSDLAGQPMPTLDDAQTSRRVV